jgi:isoleucyl-tRNA synthetase
MPFDPLKDNFTIPKAEEQILEFWEKSDVFRKANVQAEDRPHFVFYEGPPTANGMPGIHHVISRTIKDLVCRFRSMRGYRVDRKGGWDTHGLPVEIEVEKQLKLTSKPQVVEYGITKFNEQCRVSVFRYLDEWTQLTRRIGYWIDLDDAYVTLRNEYIETVWWILKNFFDRDLIYKGFKTIPYCPRCETGLSSHEVAQGYDLVKDPSVYVKVKAADDDFSYLVWTTTPWTLPSNAALCMKADADYVLVEYQGEKMVLAEALVWKTFGGDAEVSLFRNQRRFRYPRGWYRHRPHRTGFRRRGLRGWPGVRPTGVPGNRGQWHLQRLCRTLQRDVRQGCRSGNPGRSEEIGQAVQEGTLRTQLPVLLAV